MPPKAVAPAAPAAIEKKEGAKVVYIVIALQNDELRQSVNPSCRCDIILYTVLKVVTKELVTRITAGESQLLIMRAGAAPDDADQTEVIVNTTTALQRMRAILQILESSSASTLDLIDGASNTPISIAKSLELQGTEVLRPGGTYKLASISGGGLAI